MLRLTLASTLLLSASIQASSPGQFFEVDCYINGDLKQKASFPNTPPCWVHTNYGLASCSEKQPNGKCGPNAIDIFDFKKDAKHPIKKCKPKKPLTNVQPEVLPQLPNKVVYPVEQPPKYEVLSATPSSTYPTAPTSSSAYPVSPAPSTTTQSSNPAYPSNTNSDYEVAPVPVGGKCPLPQDTNIMPVTPELGNRGWAISPDQECKPGSWCPYACKPGMYSAQFDQSAKVNGPTAGSMNGGLLCDAQGQLIKPFPERPLCAQGMSNVFIDNRLEGKVSLCQTVYPGNEAMLVPTIATPKTLQVINTPPKTYWQSTSSHYYINPVNSSLKDCIWGKNSLPVGNWSPFVAGSNEGFEGNTFVKIGINPEFVTANLRGQVAKPYKLTIECDGPCNANVGCQITINDPIDKFCVTTIPKGSKARIVLSY